MKKNQIWVVIITLVILIVGTLLIIQQSTAPQGNVACKHNYSEPVVVSAPQLFDVGQQQVVCKKCGHVEQERIAATIDLPQLYLDGSVDGLSKTSECVLQAKYMDAETQVDAYAAIKYQGHTAMQYDKKNFTIKFFEDAFRNKKYKISLNGWEELNKYCLKANYIDYSSARNIVSSNIWQDVVASRQRLDANIAELEFLGGIDGYPFALFINGEYQGLYTFNIPKDEDTYEIADGENEAMFVINSAFSDAANFKALLTQEDKKAVFDLEYAYPEDAQWPYDSIDDLLEFVMNNDGDAFVAGIEEYLDVDAAIDYLITAYVLGLTDNFAKNMVLLTYDGHKWIPNMYDLDTACGLIFDGSGYLAPDFSLPSKSDTGVISSGTDSLLWDRILNNYQQIFKQRYFALREGTLDTEVLIKRYEDFCASVPTECYTQETVLYPNIPQKNVDQMKQISEFLRERTKLLDAVIDDF